MADAQKLCGVAVRGARHRRAVAPACWYGHVFQSDLAHSLAAQQRQLVEQKLRATASVLGHKHRVSAMSMLRLGTSTFDPVTPSHRLLGEDMQNACDGVDCQCMEMRHLWHQYHQPDQTVDRAWTEEPKFETTFDRVFCHARTSIIQVEPKTGMFQVRMVCKWKFRTASPKNDTEISYRGVPGIRVPGLETKVLESRVWKDLASTDIDGGPKHRNTITWRGTSIFVMKGFKKYLVRDFPFDRHVISLHQIDFVWRPSKDDPTFYDSMKVVWLRVDTSSVLSEWQPLSALVEPDQWCTSSDAGDSKTFASKFKIRLRIERVHGFYVRQIFLISTLIALSTCSPLGMPPSEDAMSTRLSVYGSGLLTLVAFKYGVIEHLPSVPYNTFTDDYLMMQIMMVVFAILECLIAYRWEIAERGIDQVENVLLVMLCLGWSCFLSHVWFVKPNRRTAWCQVSLGDPDADLERSEADDDFQNPNRQEVMYLQEETTETPLAWIPR
ncbi:unnamed protein product [Effrenium voratum]|uniref:Uncharacterized protein n=1 Tax=Effrenium voratum TaxID=2562239 RepID=A0AA36J7E1_9DINO|nr:unnamed protein product [Effrenium voratum]